MNIKKFLEQKVLAQVLIGCGAVIVVASFLNNRMNSTTIFGFVFLTIGILTFQKARKDDQQLKQ